jgi:hypothetical protein
MAGWHIPATDETQRVPLATGFRFSVLKKLLEIRELFNRLVASHKPLLPECHSTAEPKAEDKQALGFRHIEHVEIIGKARRVRSGIIGVCDSAFVIDLIQTYLQSLVKDVAYVFRVIGLHLSS